MRTLRDSDYYERFPYMKPTFFEQMRSKISARTAAVVVSVLLAWSVHKTDYETPIDSLSWVSEAKAREMMLGQDLTVPDNFSDVYTTLIEPFWFWLVENGISDFWPADMVEISDFYENPTPENLDWVRWMYQNPELDIGVFNIFDNYHLASLKQNQI